MSRVRGVVLALALCGCATQRPAPERVAPEPVAEEIVRWEEAARKEDRPIEAYRRLFVLYSVPALTAPDYARSAAALANYLALDPAASKDVDVRRWQAVFSALQEARAGARKEKEDNAALRNEVRELKKNLTDARKDNQELRETLEKLKQLDLEMDRLRKGR